MRRIIAIALVVILVFIISVLLKNKANPKDTIVCSSTCSLQDTFTDKVFEKKEPDYFIQQIVSSLLIEKTETAVEDITAMPGDVTTLISAKSNGNQYIIYNPDYVNSLRQGVNGDMMLRGILSHMIAHHMLSHKESKEDYNYLNEYHADKYAGSIMYSFIKDSEQASTLFYSLANEASKHQISVNRRIIAMNEGWKSEYVPPVVPNPPIPQPMPSITNEEIIAFLDEWVGAQIQNDFDRYSKMYSYDFTGVRLNHRKRVKLLNYNGWLDHVIKHFSNIQNVEYDELTILSSDDRNIRIRFTQVYITDTYNDKGIKEMTLKKDMNGKILIVNEEMKTSESLYDL
jgi:hypothetical protein